MKQEQKGKVAKQRMICQEEFSVLSQPLQKTYIYKKKKLFRKHCRSDLTNFLPIKKSKWEKKEFFSKIETIDSTVLIDFYSFHLRFFKFILLRLNEVKEVLFDCILYWNKVATRQHYRQKYPV